MHNIDHWDDESREELIWITEMITKNETIGGLAPHRHHYFHLNGMENPEWDYVDWRITALDFLANLKYN